MRAEAETSAPSTAAGNAQTMDPGRAPWYKPGRFLSTFHKGASQRISACSVAWTQNPQTQLCCEKGCVEDDRDTLPLFVRKPR